jgi:hypothetical protein
VYAVTYFRKTLSHGLGFYFWLYQPLLGRGILIRSTEGTSKFI